AINLRTPGPRMPEVQKWVATVGRDLQPQNNTGLRAINSTAQELPPSLAEREKGKTISNLWKVVDGDWRLRIAPVVSESGETGKPVAVAENVAAVAHDGSWLRELRCWLYQPSDAGLSVRLPMGCELLAAHLDARDIFTASL